MPKKVQAKREIEKKFTALDIIKGLLFCLLAYLVIVLLFAIFKLVSEKIHIENPLIVIIGVATLLILGGFGVALSKVLEAGYGKNLFTELIKIRRRK